MDFRRIHEFSLNSMDFHQIPWIFTGFPWNSMKIIALIEECWSSELGCQLRGHRQASASTAHEVCWATLQFHLCLCDTTARVHDRKQCGTEPETRALCQRDLHAPAASSRRDYAYTVGPFSENNACTGVRLSRNHYSEREETRSG